MPKATSLAAAIQKARPGATVETKPGGRGDFVVTADGALLWDKKRRDGDRFPQHDEILRQLGKG
ncbi:MAG: Rdx family protein [Planctomycetota bacterium]